MACRFSDWKLMVLRRNPFFLAHITMQRHHVTGMPMGTCQCNETGFGLWCAVGVARGLSSAAVVGLSYEWQWLVVTCVEHAGLV